MSSSAVTAKRVALLGRGALALHACEVVHGVDGWSLVKVVAVAAEPDWDLRLSDEVEARWPQTHVSRSGDWKELLDEDYDLVLSVLYDRVVGRPLIERSGRILNCHLGRLPEYRGMRPINWALKNGESIHGVTIHEIVEKVDAGPIVAQVTFTIWPQVDEVRAVWLRSMAYARQLLSDTLPRIDELEAVPQDESRARTYYGSQSHLLGDRQDWTRRTSLQPSAR